LSDSRIPSFIRVPLSLFVFKLLGLSSWKCDVCQFPLHLLTCFHFLVLNTFSNFLLISIPTLKDQLNESNTLDSHHLVFRAWLCRFGIGMEVYYTRCLTEGHPCLVAFDYKAKTMLWAKDWWRNSSYQQPFIWIKHGSNSVHSNVWKKYYVILLPWTLVIFFWDGHGFVLKHSILINVPFIWDMRDIKRSRNLWQQDKSVRFNVGWGRKQKKKE